MSLRMQQQTSTQYTPAIPRSTQKNSCSWKDSESEPMTSIAVNQEMKRVAQGLVGARASLVEQSFSEERCYRWMDVPQRKLRQALLGIYRCLFRTLDSSCPLRCCGAPRPPGYAHTPQVHSTTNRQIGAAASDLLQARPFVVQGQDSGVSMCDSSRNSENNGRHGGAMVREPAKADIAARLNRTSSTGPVAGEPIMSSSIDAAHLQLICCLGVQCLSYGDFVPMCLPLAVLVV